MAIEFRRNSSREALYRIAVSKQIAVAVDADRLTIIAALDAYNAANPEPEADATTTADNAGEGAQGGTGAPKAPGTTTDTPAADSTAQGGTAAENSEHVSFAYAGPSLPHGRLKENAVFRGKKADVLNYLADVLEDYPQVEKLIVPTTRLAAFRARVKTPGNIAHKYYNDIVLAMRGNQEV